MLPIKKCDALTLNIHKTSRRWLISLKFFFCICLKLICRASVFQISRFIFFIRVNQQIHAGVYSLCKNQTEERRWMLYWMKNQRNHCILRNCFVQNHSFWWAVSTKWNLLFSLLIAQIREKNNSRKYFILVNTSIVMFLFKFAHTFYLAWKKIETKWLITNKDNVRHFFGIEVFGIVHRITSRL